MITETIIKPIGKGQYTFPKAWRDSLGINNKAARARFVDNTIVIEAFEETPKEMDWDVGTIDINLLNDETIQSIKQSHKDYINKNTSAFISEGDFWDGVFKK